LRLPIKASASPTRLTNGFQVGRNGFEARCE
jgi:hypothetical protein